MELELKELEGVLGEFLNVSREIQRLVSNVEPRKVFNSLLHLREVYLALGGNSVSPKDPLTFWTELIALETYLPPAEREALRPFKHLVELSMSGLSKNLGDKILGFLYVLMPKPEPRP